MEAPGTLRVLLTLHYDGSAFHGWQVQPDQLTVQGTLQDTLSRLIDRPCTVVGSGRTDTGVHASGQVASADVPVRWTPDALMRALNATLPDSVWVESVRAARPDFHPRYDALARTYVYKVGTVPESASPFHRRWCWALGEKLDPDALAAAAACLVGEHSFSAFAKAGQPERGDRCSVSLAEWSEWRLGLLFTITADRYLHHMVRYLVGTMVEMALGRRDGEDMPRLLQGDVDTITSPPAPPQGLFLRRVEYPDTVLVNPDSSSRSAAPA